MHTDLQRRPPARWSPAHASEARVAGFTLIELLTVIAILAILSGLITVAVTKSRQSANLKITAATIQRLTAAADAYEGLRGDYPPTSLEDTFQIAGNRVNSGIESLLAHIVSDDNCTAFEYREQDLGNTDNDRLQHPQLLGELRWTFGDDQLREVLDHWGTPFIYVHSNEYGRSYDIIDGDGVRGKATASRSSVTANWHAPGKFQIWSAGPDRKNQDGAGDDVSAW